MQWLINDFKQLKEDVMNKIDAAVDNWAQRQLQAAEEIQKLKDEIKAMKARQGKQKD